MFVIPVTERRIGFNRLFHLCFGPVDKVEMFGGTSEGGVKPMDVIGCEHLVCHVSLVEVDVCPLSALCFVTGDSITELYL